MIPVEPHALLLDVCGPMHAHLVQFETLTHARFDCPGGGVAITGAEKDAALAESAFRLFVDRVRGGAAANEAEISAAVDFARARGVADGTGDRGYGAPLALRGRDGLVTGRTGAQRAYLAQLTDAANRIVFGVGPAGTGKTWLAVAAGVAALQAKQIGRLIITRPAVEAGERLGFLPGGLEDKVDPYMRPIWDALHEFLGKDDVDRKISAGIIEVAPLAFMRGRTLADAFILLDEAQNATRGQMKMALTRIGRGGRLVVTGDPTQIDLPHAQQSGLSHAIGLLSEVRGIAMTFFRADDVQREPIVAAVLRAYDAAERSE
ncbi:MAG TPA: phosphate starvation-inducible protein PhoH [Hyphomonadaceae bacterium]|nr:phosphate starvation-inducible protein PhoH [Hyphomonadaceae bacterium]